MGQERLNSLIMANTHTDLLDTINVTAVVQDFTNLQDSRKKMYGTFM
jgi:hypothetical protein